MTTSPTSKSMFSVCLFLVLTLLPFFNPQNADASRTVRAAIYNFKPMVYSDTDGSAQGFFVKILNHIAQKENWNVQYVPGTWQEGLDRLKSDQLDLLLCIGYTDARDNYLDFPKEFLLLDWGTIYKAKGSSINNIFDLEGKTVSILKGSVLPAGFQELINQFHIHVTMKEMDQASEVLASVVSGSVDAGVAANLSGILNKAWQKVERTPIIFTPSKLGFAVNEGKDGDLIAVLDREIAAIKSDKSSIYYRELEHLLVNKEHEIPKEVYWVLSGIVAALLLALAWNIILKRQVRAKTEHLEAEIVERKQIEGSLRYKEEKFRTLFEHVADYALVTQLVNGELIIVDLNESACRHHGYTRDELIGQSLGVLDPVSISPDNVRLEKLKSGKTLNFEATHRRKDGSTFPVEVLIKAIEIEGEEVFFAIERDITLRKQAEEQHQVLEAQLRQKYKMEAVGMMAGGVAHDFNNILSIILTNLELSIRKIENNDPVLQKIENAKSATIRGGELVKQILAYSRQGERLSEPVQFATLVEGSLGLLRSTFPTTIEILNQVEVDAHSAVLHGDPIQLEEVVMNLCQNAVHAMGGKGLLTVSLKKQFLNEQDFSAQKNFSAGEYFVLIVEDTGHGISKDKIEKIFDPFFTTKPTGHGTGMGLSICHGIVDQHNGFIKVTSTSDVGTGFYVYLPITGTYTESEDSQIQESEKNDLPVGNEHILLVDDEEYLVQSVADALRDRGYIVTTQTSSREALELFTKTSDIYHMVITDQTMPEMTGMELSAELLNIRPNLPIILCTGYSSTTDEEKAKDAGISAFFLKPLSTTKLLITIRDILDS